MATIIRINGSPCKLDFQSLKNVVFEENGEMRYEPMRSGFIKHTSLMLSPTASLIEYKKSCSHVQQ